MTSLETLDLENNNLGAGLEMAMAGGEDGEEGEREVGVHITDRHINMIGSKPAASLRSMPAHRCHRQQAPRPAAAGHRLPPPHAPPLLPALPGQQKTGRHLRAAHT